MNRSTDRILTTHSGSLIRTREIIEGWKARTLHKPYDQQLLREDIRRGTIDVVGHQVEVGIDVPNDGEYGRPSKAIYDVPRIGGIEQVILKPGDKNPLDGKGHELEKNEFPGFFSQYASSWVWMLPDVDMHEMENVKARSEIFRLVEPLHPVGLGEVERDIGILRAGLEGLPVSDAFITSVTPTTGRKDAGILDFYDSVEEYQYAIADILHDEYKAITDAGFILQLDRAAQEPILNLEDESLFFQVLDEGIDVTNYALRGIPEDRVRLHWCGGGSNRPHTQDIELPKVVKSMLRINAGAYAIEAASPRHQHEYRIWEDVKLPEGKILIPGVISQTTNVVEHPETVAWRITNFAELVGRENVIAGVDCGFSPDWDTPRVHAEIQWAKFKSLAEGAAIASRELWKA